jgi:hypothetical protein
MKMTIMKENAEIFSRKQSAFHAIKSVTIHLESNWKSQILQIIQNLVQYSPKHFSAEIGNSHFTALGCFRFFIFHYSLEYIHPRTRSPLKVMTLRSGFTCRYLYSRAFCRPPQTPRFHYLQYALMEAV